MTNYYSYYHRTFVGKRSEVELSTSFEPNHFQLVLKRLTLFTGVASVEEKEEERCQWLLWLFSSSLFSMLLAHKARTVEIKILLFLKWIEIADVINSFFFIQRLLPCWTCLMMWTSNQMIMVSFSWWSVWYWKKVDGVHITDIHPRLLHPRFSWVAWPSWGLYLLHKLHGIMPSFVLATIIFSAWFYPLYFPSPSESFIECYVYACDQWSFYVLLEVLYISEIEGSYVCFG